MWILLITNTESCLIMSWLLGGTAAREHGRISLLEEEYEKSC